MTNIEERPGATSREFERITSGTAPICDENGAIEPDFLRDVTVAIEADDKALVRALTGRLHEVDLGLLVVSLEPELRPKLVEMMGEEFDFAACKKNFAGPEARRGTPKFPARLIRFPPAS
jgi:hypothetical protein